MTAEERNARIIELRVEETKLINEVAKFDLFQKATKISLNSL